MISFSTARSDLMNAVLELWAFLSFLSWHWLCWLPSLASSKHTNAICLLYNEFIYYTTRYTNYNYHILPAAQLLLRFVTRSKSIERSNTTSSIRLDTIIVRPQSSINMQLFYSSPTSFILLGAGWSLESMSETCPTRGAKSLAGWKIITNLLSIICGI